jgi:hypothetical protein
VGVRRWIDQLNRAQRIVPSIGLAAALVALGRAVELSGGGSSGGWFGYAPSAPAPAIFTDGGPFLLRHPVLDVLWWLFLIALWVAASVWLFTSRHVGRPPPEPPR